MEPAGSDAVVSSLYAIAAVAAVGIIVLWLRRRRETRAELKEMIG